MFYNYILDLINDKGLYTSVKPTHHINKYYQELKQLNLDDIITLNTPTKKISIERNKFIYTPAIWQIVDLDALKKKANSK